MRISVARYLWAPVVGVLLSAQMVSAQDPPKTDAGMKIYAAQKCGVCHSIAGKGAKKGPLDGVGTKLTPADIRQWIVDAPGMTKKANATRKPAMKSYAHLPKDDVDALVAYLQTLK